MAQAGANPPTRGSYEDLASALVAQLEKDRQDLAKRLHEVKAATQQMEEKKRELEEIERRIFGIADGVDDIVELNVGGTPMSTTRAVLCSVSGSMLSGLFSGNFEKGHKRDGDGKVFLDVDPAIFTKVLSHLRLRRIASPECPAPLPQVPQEVRAEFDMLINYYGLDTCIPPSSSSINIFETIAEEGGVDQGKLLTNGLVNIVLTSSGGATADKYETLLSRDGIDNRSCSAVENSFQTRPSTIQITFLKHRVRVEAMELRTSNSCMSPRQTICQISSQWRFKHGSREVDMEHDFSLSGLDTGRLEMQTLSSTPPVDEVSWTFPEDFSLVHIVLHGWVFAK